MGTLERTETLAHRLGTSGRISIKTIGGLLRVRGVEGDEARMTVAYRIRAADHAAAERALETGRVLVDRGPGSLEVETPERRLSTGLAWLFGGARVSAVDYQQFIFPGIIAQTLLFTVNVYGYKRDLGQRIRINERNPWSHLSRALPFP